MSNKNTAPAETVEQVKATETAEQVQATETAEQVQAPETENAAKDTQKIKPGDELVEYTAPLMPGETKRDIFVAVNGESIRIKRGETVKIKRKFLNALNDASKQQYAAYQSSMKAQEQGKKPLANM